MMSLGYNVYNMFTHCVKIIYCVSSLLVNLYSSNCFLLAFSSALAYIAQEISGCIQQHTTFMDMEDILPAYAS